MPTIKFPENYAPAENIWLIQSFENEDGTVSTVLDVQKCRFGQQGMFEITKHPTDPNSRYFSLNSYQKSKDVKKETEKSKKQNKIKDDDESSFINDEEFESDDSLERSKPVTRRTELKSLKKQLKISETKNREKDIELEKLRAKLKAAGIEI